MFIFSLFVLFLFTTHGLCGSNFDIDLSVPNSTLFMIATWDIGGSDCSLNSDSCLFDSGEYLSVYVDNDGCPGDCQGKDYSCCEYRTTDIDYGFGYVGAWMKLPDGDISGTNIALFLYRDANADEIDIEFLGKHQGTKFQTNYFDAGTGGHENIVDLGFDSRDDFHEYGISWNSSCIKWWVDGTQVHLECEDDVPTGEFHILVGVSVVDADSAGLVEWLGPFTYTGELETKVSRIRYVAGDSCDYPSLVDDDEEEDTMGENDFDIILNGTSELFWSANWDSSSSQCSTNSKSCVFSSENYLSMLMEDTDCPDDCQDRDYSCCYYRTASADYTNGYMGIWMKAPEQDTDGTSQVFYLYNDNTGGTIAIAFYGNEDDEFITYYSGGNDEFFSFGFNPSSDFHEYGISWNSSDCVVFWVDGQKVNEGCTTFSSNEFFLVLSTNIAADSSLGTLSYTEPIEMQIKRIRYVERDDNQYPILEVEEDENEEVNYGDFDVEFSSESSLFWSAEWDTTNRCSYNPQSCDFSSGSYLSMLMEDTNCPNDCQDRDYSCCYFRTAVTNYSYGYVGVWMKAPEQETDGTYGSLFMYNDENGDSISFNLYGRYTGYLTSFCSDGSCSDQSYFGVYFDMRADFVEYGISWNSSCVKWWVDGNAINEECFMVKKTAQNGYFICT